MTIPISATTDNLPEFSASVSLISGLWLAEVDRHVLDILFSETVRSTYENLGGSLPTDTSRATLDSLAYDYCRLLIGPKNHLPPVQSIWAEQQFQGTAAASCQEFYELLPGFQPPSSIVDHLGNQLDFLAHLLDPGLDQELSREIIQNFRNKHLAWCPPFLTRVAAKAESDFYRGLVRVTVQLLDEIQ